MEGKRARGVGDVGEGSDGLASLCCEGAYVFIANEKGIGMTSISDANSMGCGIVQEANGSEEIPIELIVEGFVELGEENTGIGGDVLEFKKFLFDHDGEKGCGNSMSTNIAKKDKKSFGGRGKYVKKISPNFFHGDVEIGKRGVFLMREERVLDFAGEVKVSRKAFLCLTEFVTFLNDALGDVHDRIFDFFLFFDVENFDEPACFFAVGDKGDIDEAGNGARGIGEFHLEVGNGDFAV